MLDSYRLRMAALGGYEGEARRRNAQKIMDASWMRDPATKPVYVKWVNSGLPVVNENDVPVYAKYNVKSYHNITGDAIAYLLEFRLEDMQENPNIRVGSYVQIMNEMDEPEWWLIVHYDDRLQFRQFSILKCTWTYKWVSRTDGNRKVYECLGAPRKQNSYNSGVWLDYYTQTVENQEVMWLPTNDDTKTILYDTKFLKSSPGRYPGIKWTVTKIEDTAVEGISMFTMAQTQFDPAVDNVHLGIADYGDPDEGSNKPEPEETIKSDSLEITYSGKPSVRAGGGYKKLSLKTRVDGELIELPENIANSIKWTVNFDGKENNLTYITDRDPYIIEDDPYTVIGHPFKVKCDDEYSLIGEVFTITATSEYGSKSIIMEVASL